MNENKDLKEEVNDKSEKSNINENQTPNKKEKKDRFRKELEAKDEQIKEAKEQLEVFKDKYYRAIADMDNQKKLYEKEYRQALKYSSQNLAEKLLPSFEMFSMVMEAVDNLPAEVAPYVQGFDMIYRQMIQALESEGISEIKTKVGDKFDHTIHSAMETQVVEDENQIDTVIKIVRKGYKIYDRLLRPVTVVVGKAKQEEKQEVKEENEVEA